MTQARTGLPEMTEAEFVAHFGLPDEHCLSCHADAADGYPIWTGIELNDGTIVEVCCDVSTAYEKHVEALQSRSPGEGGRAP